LRKKTANYHENGGAKGTGCSVVRIALRISATATELLFPVASPPLIRGTASAPAPFLSPVPDGRGCGESTDDEMRLYTIHFRIISHFSPIVKRGDKRKGKVFSVFGRESEKRRRKNGKERKKFKVFSEVFTYFEIFCEYPEVFG